MMISGIARGCGWQKIGAVVNLASFYFIGIPLGVVLAFVLHLGGKVPNAYNSIMFPLNYFVTTLLIFEFFFPGTMDWDHSCSFRADVFPVDHSSPNRLGG